MKYTNCTVSQCSKKHTARGFCVPHYRLFMKNGSTDYERQPQPKICSVHGCANKPHSRTLCNKHYHRFNLRGSTEDRPVGWGRRRHLHERFWEKVNVNAPGGCWEWTGSRTMAGRGYGTIGIGGRSTLAHRVSWEIKNGPIPDGPGHHGVCVLHRCDNPPCVRPDHLFLGTQKDNVEDMDTKGRRRNRLDAERLAEKIVREKYAARSSSALHGEQMCDNQGTSPLGQFYK